MIGNLRISLVAVATLSIFGLMFAGLAHADGTDPNVTINKGGGSPMTTAGATQNDPLVITDASGDNDFLYEGPATNEFFVEVIPYTGEDLTYFENENWTCTPGLATTCGYVSPCTPGAGATCPDPPLPGFEFAFYGPTTPGADFITPGLDIEVITPEPQTLALLLGGLGLLFWFGMKRRVPDLT